MADSSLSARVAEIVDGLQSLTRMAPGMPVKADDWNTVVGAVIDVARLLSARTAAAPAHTHAGQVGRDRLDPAMGDLVDTMRAQQRAQAERIQEMATRLDRIEARLTTLGDQVGTLQSLADREADASLDRDVLLKRIGERVDGHDVISSQLSGLNLRLDALEPRIEDATRLRRELTGPGGTLPDLIGVQAKLTELERVRENLRLGDGSLGRLRDMERRLETFEKLGTDERALAARVDGVVQASLAQRALDTASIGGLVDARLANVMNPLSATVRGLSDSVSGLQSTVAAHGGVLSSTTSRLGALDAVAAAMVDVPSRVGALDAWRTSTASSLSALRADVDATLALRAQVGSLGTSLHDVSARLDGVALQTKALDGMTSELRTVVHRTSELEHRLGGLATRDELAQLNTRLDGAVRDMKSTESSVRLLDATLGDYRRVTDTRLGTLDGRVGALQDSGSKIALELGGLNQRMNVLRGLNLPTRDR